MRKNEFIITKPEFVNKTFRLPASLVERMGKRSSEAGVSMNEFTVQALEFALKNLVIKKKDDN